MRRGPGCSPIASPASRRYPSGSNESCCGGCTAIGAGPQAGDGRRDPAASAGSHVRRSTWSSWSSSTSTFRTEPPEAEVEERESAEAAAAAEAGRTRGISSGSGSRPRRTGETKAVGLYRADSKTQLDGLLGALPLGDWMHVTVTPLEPHPNDPADGRRGHSVTSASRAAPDPRLPPRGHARGSRSISGHRPGSPPHRAADRRDLHRSRDQRDAASRAPAPTGRSSCRTGPRSATSATRCRPTAATCSTSNRAACATAAAEVLARLGARRGRRRQRVHLPHLNPDRDRRTRARLAEQGRLHQRRRPPGREA